MNKKVEMPDVGIEEIEIQAGDSPERGAEIYREYGALVVRGLLADCVEEVHADIEAAAQDAIARSCTRNRWLGTPSSYTRMFHIFSTN